MRQRQPGWPAGTAFYGGPEDAGGFDGLQAQYARIPLAHANLVALPVEMADEQAILLSDIFPTAWFGARLAEITPGDTVAVFGCGPVGQFAILSACLQGAGRVIAVDGIDDRLAIARLQHGAAMNKNLTIKAGNCNHRRYLPELVALVTSGSVDPRPLLTEHEPLTDVIAAYEEFDRRDRAGSRSLSTRRPTR